MTGATSIFGLLSRSRPAAAAVQDPLLSLYAAWERAMDDVDRLDAEYADMAKRIPAHFQPGDDYTGTISNHPALNFNHPCWRDWKVGTLGNRPSLQSVKLFNRWDQTIGRAEDGPGKRAEARNRIRLWIAAQRAQRACMARLGLPDLEAKKAAAMDRADDVEAEIIKTPARSMAGAAVKLRLWVRQTLVDSPANLDPSERAIVSALGDLERMVGGSGL